MRKSALGWSGKSLSSSAWRLASLIYRPSTVCRMTGTLDGWKVDFAVFLRIGNWRTKQYGELYTATEPGIRCEGLPCRNSFSYMARPFTTQHRAPFDKYAVIYMPKWGEPMAVALICMQHAPIRMTARDQTAVWDISRMHSLVPLLA